MFEQSYLSALAYEAIQSAETSDGRELELGEIVRLEIEMTEVTPAVEVQGRTGTFYKFSVAYEVLAEFEKDVEMEEEVEVETARRAIRLNAEGKLLAISDRIYSKPS